jgi:hypothetical protein
MNITRRQNGLFDDQTKPLKGIGIHHAKPYILLIGASLFHGRDIEGQGITLVPTLHRGMFIVCIDYFTVA